jgi:hypothetical protein
MIVPIEEVDDSTTLSLSDWNYLPLCSRDESEGWGCSERLERHRVEQEMEAVENQQTSVNAIDWLLSCYPLKLQEISIRLQLTHGDQFGLTAGESLCLRFVRDVYGTGEALRRLDSIPSSVSSLENWRSQRLGFVCDILDIADAYSSHTDREMMNIIEMKRKLSTPLSSRKIGGSHPLSSPSLHSRRSQPSTPLLFSPLRGKKAPYYPEIQEENEPLNSTAL